RAGRLLLVAWFAFLAGLLCAGALRLRVPARTFLAVLLARSFALARLVVPRSLGLLLPGRRACVDFLLLLVLLHEFFGGFADVLVLGILTEVIELSLRKFALRFVGTVQVFGELADVLHLAVGIGFFGRGCG